VSQADLLARIGSKDPDLVVLDVRTPAEYAAGHVPGALNIPHDVLASRIAELAAARDKQVVLYCRSGRRSSLAADVLSKAGFTRLGHLEGDYLAWEAEQRPIDR
jgi:rhodanese-related sulfurtransferase